MGTIAGVVAHDEITVAEAVVVEMILGTTPRRRILALVEAMGEEEAPIQRLAAAEAARRGSSIVVVEAIGRVVYLAARRARRLAITWETEDATTTGRVAPGTMAAHGAQEEEEEPARRGQAHLGRVAARRRATLGTRVLGLAQRVGGDVVRKYSKYAYLRRIGICCALFCGRLMLSATTRLRSDLCNPSN